jgi:hypothetical protein
LLLANHSPLHPRGVADTVTAMPHPQARGHGRPSFRRFAPLLLAGLGLALWPNSVEAATVFGADMTKSPDGTTTFLSVVNVIEPDGSPDNGAPVSGILTSVRIKTRGIAATGVMRVLSEVDHPNATTYRFNNTAPEIPVSVAADATRAGHITEVLTRRPIAAGQRLGWQSIPSTSEMDDDYFAPSGECAFSELFHSLGADLNYTTMLCNHNLLLTSGTIEGDADGDGFGDETQDACPTNASTQGTCPKKKCKKKHRKHSAEAAKKKCKKKRR